jgi:hypothetical protein
MKTFRYRTFNPVGQHVAHAVRGASYPGNRSSLWYSVCNRYVLTRYSSVSADCLAIPKCMLCQRLIG